MKKKTEMKANGIKIFMQRTTQNDIFLHPSFINMRDVKVGTHYTRKYATTRSRYSDFIRPGINIRSICQ